MTMNQMIYSEPVKVVWAGWESDTLTLQRCGWRISADESQYGSRVGIAIHHKELDTYGVSDMMDFDYMRRRIGQYNSMQEMLRMQPLVFGMQMAQQVQVHMMMQESPRYMPVDATPMRMEESLENLEDLALFHSMPKPEKDIILPPPSFDEIMQLALEHQAPKQKELREKARRTVGSGLILRAAA